MDRSKIIAAILVSVFLLTACNFLGFATFSKDTAVLYSNNDKIVLDIDVADEKEEMVEGLTSYENLSDNKGLLFVFPDEKIRRFYTKDMNFAIDIIFISDQGNIVDMVKNFESCERDPCPVYESGRIAKYALEVNAGFIEKNNILIGDKVKINI